LRRSGSVMWKIGTSKVLTPRLCRLRTHGLALTSKYWTYRSHVRDMSPVNLVADCQQKFVFPHCLIGCYGREAGYGPTNRSVVVLWVGLGALLLGGSWSVQICWRLHERLLCANRMRYVWSRTIRRLSVGCMCRVGRVSPAGCTLIRIAATFGYE
jgi:hypothetical protein